MPVVGWLKRLKKMASVVNDKIIQPVNNLYKKHKDVIGGLMNMDPYGNYINTGLQTASKAVDVVSPVISNLTGNVPNRQFANVLGDSGGPTVNTKISRR